MGKERERRGGEHELRGAEPEDRVPHRYELAKLKLSPITKRSITTPSSETGMMLSGVGKTPSPEGETDRPAGAGARRSSAIC
jgi:hypothetical protein